MVSLLLLNVKRVCIWVLVCGFSYPTTSAAAEPARLACKIKDQLLLAVSDGKPERYSHLENDVTVGDRFTLVISGGRHKYTLNAENKLFERLGVSIDGENKFFSEKVGALRLAHGSRRVEFTYKEDRKSKAQARGVVSDLHVYLGPNELGFVRLSSLPGSVEKFHLDRYYKNDWGGLYTESLAFFDAKYTRVLAVDCRGLDQNLDNLFIELNSPPKDLSSRDPQ